VRLIRHRLRRLRPSRQHPDVLRNQTRAARSARPVALSAT
jgi:hypothetical protein